MVREGDTGENEGFSRGLMAERSGPGEEGKDGPLVRGNTECAAWRCERTNPEGSPLSQRIIRKP